MNYEGQAQQVKKKKKKKKHKLNPLAIHRH